MGKLMEEYGDLGKSVYMGPFQCQLPCTDKNVLLFLVQGGKLYQENFISSLRQKVRGQRTLPMSSVSHCLQLKKKSTCQGCTFVVVGSDALHVFLQRMVQQLHLLLCLALLPRPKGFQHLFWLTISLDLFPQSYCWSL